MVFGIHFSIVDASSQRHLKGRPEPIPNSDGPVTSSYCTGSSLEAAFRSLEDLRVWWVVLTTTISV
jgi:hypothetical protein